MPVRVPRRKHPRRRGGKLWKTRALTANEKIALAAEVAEVGETKRIRKLAGFVTRRKSRNDALMRESWRQNRPGKVVEKK